ncbi:MAG: SOS response-associated peptidase [Clostridiales bacterium]|nr:SOS response-associated peptidase [Clostridiales bacterium]
MCSRYYIDNGVFDDVKEVLSGAKRSELKVTSCDVHPGENAPVLIKGQNGLQIDNMKWGFPQYTGKGLIINARSETAHEKKTFSDSLLYRRCVIPARHFYEWDSSKNKASFSRENGASLYMAGFYNLLQDEMRFVILTTKANPSVKPIHERMPLILERNELKNWIYDADSTQEVLRKIPLPLKQYQEYKQQTLFDGI